MGAAGAAVSELADGEEAFLLLADLFVPAHPLSTSDVIAISATIDFKPAFFFLSLRFLPILPC